MMLMYGLIVFNMMIAVVIAALTWGIQVAGFVAVIMTSFLLMAVMIVTKDDR